MEKSTMNSTPPMLQQELKIYIHMHKYVFDRVFNIKDTFGTREWIQGNKITKEIELT